MKSDEHMAKYTLREMAATLMPAKQVEATTLSFGKPTLNFDFNGFNEMALSQDGLKYYRFTEATETCLVIPLYIKSSGVSDGMQLKVTIGRVDSQKISVKGNKTVNAIFNFAPGEIKLTTWAVTVYGKSYGSLTVQIQGNATLYKLEPLQAPTTVSGCLTAIADYIRSHSNVGGGN